MARVKPTTEELRVLCEMTTRKLLSKLGADIEFLKSYGVGVTIFAFTFEEGPIAYLSTANREDMIRTLKAFVAYQDAGLTTEPRGDRGKA